MTETRENTRPVNVAPAALSPARRWWPAAAGLVAVAGAALHVAIVPVLLVWLLLAAAIPASTWCRRAILAVPAAVGAEAAIFTGLAVLHLRPDIAWVPATAAVALASYLVVVPIRPARWVDTEDAWSAAAAGAVLVTVARAVPGWSAGEYLARIGLHTDGIRHIAIARSVLVHHGYLTFLTPADLMAGFNRYPQGSSGFLATVARTVVGSNPSAGAMVEVGYWTAVAILLLTTWASTSIALRVCRQMLGRRVPPAAAAAAALACALTYGVGVGYLTFDLGYFAQEVATVALLAIVWLLCQREEGADSRVLLPAALLVVATAQSWYLLVPTLAPVAVWFWRRSTNRRLLAGAAAAALPFVAFPFLTGPSAVNQLTAFGGTRVPSTAAIAALVMGAVAATLTIWPGKATRRPATPLLLMWVGLGLLMLAVAGFELGRGGLGYYAVKLFILILMYAGIVVGLATALAIALPDARRRINAVAAAVGLLAGTAFQLPYFTEHTGKPSARSTAEASTFLAQNPHGTPEHVAYFAVDGCPGAADRLLTHAFAFLSQQEWIALDKTVPRYLIGAETDIKPLIKFTQEPGVRGVRVITSQPCEPDLVDQLSHQSNVSVVNAS